MYTWLLFIFAIVVLILIPFAPQLFRLRIRILRRLHLNWAANLLESHFQSWVVWARTLLFVIVAFLLYVGWTQ